MRNNVEIIIKPREKDIGIPVRRILPWEKKRMVGPFIFLDHMGPVLLKAPDDKINVRPHPHIGLSTLTYLFEGELLHRDSLGSYQEIKPGEVNWMTAGRGISHSERETDSSRRSNRTLHGLQFWVALPKDQEDVEPSFYHYDKSDIPDFETESLRINLVAGTYENYKSMLKTYSPMVFMILSGFKSGSFIFDEKDGEYAIYVVRGFIDLDGKSYTAGEMIVFTKGSTIDLIHSEDSLFALVGGEIFPEPRFIWWNLVSSSREKIDIAKKAWKDGSFPQVPGDFEKIPAPEN